MTNAVQLAQYGSNNVGLSFKNRLINGDMTIDQRNAGASVTPTDGQYTLDRYLFRVSQASKITVQRSSVAPVGFTNSMLVTSTASTSVGVGDFFAMEQRIEGFNTADFGYGTANASTLTLSFWVRSSLTGTFGGAFANGAFNRSYPFTYTINAANTFEYKTITIIGDTSGTWSTNSDTGFKVQFGFGVGSNFSGTAGSWQSITAWSATGATSVVGTNGATFYITGVQLEKGSNATSFDYLPYGTELALCQRYYQRMGNSNTSDVAMGSGTAQNSTNAVYYVKYATTMRTYPTATVFNLVSTDAVTYNAVITSIGGAAYSFDSARLTLTSSGGGMVQYRPAILSNVTGGTGYLDFSAEL